ncbi:MAG TPA: hypothetical protein VKS25_03360 [Solirubrobacteraceae bacterium]|nr:hypothetical protein [Solirubrobacteraceae bacterium]
MLLVALGVSLGAGGGAGLGSALAAPAPKALPAAQAFAPTGAEQVYVVPAGIALIETDLAGGNGGGGAVGMAEGGYLRVHAGEKLYVEVGADGAYEGGATFGGGGAAGAFAACPQADPDGRCGGSFAGSGGGASDVRTCSEAAKRCAKGGATLASRMIVAGGGGGQGGDGFSPGWFCTQLPQHGFGLNRQALPGGTPANGPAPVQLAGGLLIPGEPADYTYGGPIKDITASAGGAASPGAGGSMTECDTVSGSTVTERFTGSIAGAAGSGANGGAGAAVAGAFPPEGPNGYLPGSGGGGGGGYTGGGGGSTGETCSGCNDPGGGMGGGGGSSFFAKAVLGAFIDQGPASGPAVTITPLVEIDRPKNGAVYRAGQRIKAQWECGHYQGFACSGASVADGKAINMKPGKHTFTVKVSLSPTNANATAKVTYTVR